MVENKGALDRPKFRTSLPLACNQLQIACTKWYIGGGKKGGEEVSFQRPVVIIFLIYFFLVRVKLVADINTCKADPCNNSVARSVNVYKEHV